VIAGEFQTILNAPPFERVAREQYFPMSLAQERLWLSQLDEPAVAQYSIVTAVRLQGELNEAVLRDSIGMLAARHESLRTTLQFKDGVPVQIIRPEAEFGFSQHDLSDVTSAEQKKRTEQIVTAESTRPFDLQNGPLFRLALIRLSTHHHVLVLSVHRAVADTSSVGILIRELSALYRAALQGRRCALPEPWLQYGDFAVWQRRALEGVLFEHQLEYWRRQLAQIPPDLKLPWDRQRSAGRNTPNTTLHFQLSAGLCDSLKEFARREGATLVMVLMATYQSLLHHYSGQDELVVGTAVSGRDRRPVEAVVGLFENILAIRANLKGHPDFRAILRQTRTSLLEAYSNRELPFERIVDECKSRDGSDPILRTMFTFEESPLPEWHLGDLQAERLPVVNTYSSFDLVLNMQETAAEIRGEIKYSTDLFDRRTIQELAGRFQRMLQVVLENPELSISKISLS
jgi:hypothetical protein